MTKNLVEVIKTINEVISENAFIELEAFVEDLHQAFGVDKEDIKFFYNEIAIVKWAPKSKTYSKQEERFINKMVECLKNHHSKSFVYELIASVTGRTGTGIDKKYRNMLAANNKTKNQSTVQLPDELHKEEGHLVHKQPTLLSEEMDTLVNEMAAASKETAVSVMTKHAESNERGTVREKELLKEIDNLKQQLKDKQFLYEQALLGIKNLETRNAVLITKMAEKEDDTKKKEKQVYSASEDAFVNLRVVK